MVPLQGTGPAAFRGVFAVREFRALWLAQLLSVIGDQFARVALTVLVYDRTRSPALAAVTYVGSIVPAFAGGLTLSWLADRYPRRAVMVTCDLLRCALVLVMAAPGVPLGVLVALLFCVTYAGAPFTSARAAVYPDVLPGDAYVTGTAITVTTYQIAQVAGFAAGGVLAGLFGVRGSMLGDAATFAASALIIRLGVRPRPAPAGGARPAALGGGGARLRRWPALSGMRLVFGSPAMRVPMLFGWLTAFYDAPEGLVTPLARGLGGGPITVGVILATQALGVTAGSLLFSRFVAPPVRLRWMGPLAVACTGVLVAFGVRPPLTGALAIFAASGACAAYQVAANAAFVRAAPADRRGAAFGVAQAGMSLGQGVMMIAAGAAAQAMNPALVIAICGGLGTCVAVPLAVGWSRS